MDARSLSTSVYLSVLPLFRRLFSPIIMLELWRMTSFPSLHLLPSSSPHSVTSALCLPPRSISPLGSMFSVSVHVGAQSLLQWGYWIFDEATIGSGRHYIIRMKERGRGKQRGFVCRVLCLRGYKIFNTPPFIVISVCCYKVRGCDWSLHQSVHSACLGIFCTCTCAGRWNMYVCVFNMSESQRARDGGECVEILGLGGGLNQWWMKRPTVILRWRYETRREGRRTWKKRSGERRKWNLNLAKRNYYTHSSSSSHRALFNYSYYALIILVSYSFFLSLFC